MALGTFDFDNFANPVNISSNYKYPIKSIGYVFWCIITHKALVCQKVAYDGKYSSSGRRVDQNTNKTLFETIIEMINKDTNIEISTNDLNRSIFVYNTQTQHVCVILQVMDEPFSQDSLDVMDTSDGIFEKMLWVNVLKLNMQNCVDDLHGAACLLTNEYSRLSLYSSKACDPNMTLRLIKYLFI